MQAGCAGRPPAAPSPRCRAVLPALALQPSLDKAQAARPGEDVYGEAQQEMERRLVAAGYLDGEGVLRIKNNGCWFITARKP